MRKYLLIGACLFSLSCASVNYMRPFKDRTYTIDVERGVFIWRTCLRKSLFKRKCKKWYTDELDFSKKEVRQRLIDVGFVLRVRRGI